MTLTPKHLEPMRDLILVLLVSSDGDRPILAKVVARGPLVVSVAVGDTILCSQYAGTELSFGDDRYRIVLEVDVLARVLTESETTPS